MYVRMKVVQFCVHLVVLYMPYHEVAGLGRG